MHCGPTIHTLIEALYPGIQAANKPDNYYLDRTILSCKNDDVDDLNKEILGKFPGEEKVYHSADSVNMERGADANFDPYPV